MNSDPHGDPVEVPDGFLAIAVDNSSIHHYADIDQLRADTADRSDENPPDENAPDGSRSRTVDCFDGAGHRLSFDDTGVGGSVLRTAELADEKKLLERIADAIGQASERFEASPLVRAVSRTPGHEREAKVAEGRAMLAHLADLARGRYADCYKALEDSPFGHVPPDPDDGDWWHNCWAHHRCI
jgi:hypothetical protein